MIAKYLKIKNYSSDKLVASSALTATELPLSTAPKAMTITANITVVNLKLLEERLFMDLPKNVLTLFIKICTSIQRNRH